MDRACDWSFWYDASYLPASSLHISQILGRCVECIDFAGVWYYTRTRVIVLLLSRSCVTDHMRTIPCVAQAGGVLGMFESLP